MVGGRPIYRWRIASGVEQNRQHPDSIWIPSDAEKAAIRPGDLVRLLFEFRRTLIPRRNGPQGERMWVEVTDVKGDKLVGRLRNEAVFTPRLCYGRQLTFTRDHVIDIEIDAEGAFQCEYMCPECARADSHVGLESEDGYRLSPTRPRLNRPAGEQIKAAS